MDSTHSVDLVRAPRPVWSHERSDWSGALAARDAGSAASRVAWRTATLVATAVAACELVLLVVLGAVLVGDPVAEQLRGAAVEARARMENPPPPKPRADGTPRVSRAETTVLVLNGNGITGAAGVAADRLRALGYAIGSTGNAPRTDYRRTLVMYRPGYAPEARRLARDLRGAAVAPLDGLRVSELMGAHVVLVLGAR